MEIEIFQEVIKKGEPALRYKTQVTATETSTRSKGNAILIPLSAEIKLTYPIHVEIAFN